MMSSYSVKSNVAHTWFFIVARASGPVARGNYQASGLNTKQSSMLVKLARMLQEGSLPTSSTPKNIIPIPQDHHPHNHQKRPAHKAVALPDGHGSAHDITQNIAHRH